MKACDGIERINRARESEKEKIKVEEFIRFVAARHAIYKARNAKREWPWTDDPILQQFKFCNIYRELDRVTRWISSNWREPNLNDPDFWFAAVVARRCINLPATLRAIGYPVPWKPSRFLKAIERRRKTGKRVFNSDAYKVIVSGQSGDLAEVQVRMLLNPLWAAREELRPRRSDTLMTFHSRLASVPFMGSFHAAQVVADVKYIGPLSNASDWWGFAASGPGSRRGLNRVLGRAVQAGWKEGEWLNQLCKLRKIVGSTLKDFGLRRMHAQDMQNCLCEFDKYERVRLGEGTIRRFRPEISLSP